MTIQEKAIEQLERISRNLASIGEKEDYTDVAIQALEQQPCEEDILKLFYVESSDDYLIGRRLDTMYYAEWNFELQAFVWTYSNLSEPKEIPFSEWIKGFLEKYGGSREKIGNAPSVTPQRPKTGHCKDCKYFEYDSVAKVDGVPLIVAHEICKKWGDGCKTKEDGHCFLYEPQESEEEK